MTRLLAVEVPRVSAGRRFRRFASFEHFDDGSTGVSAIEVIDLATGARSAVAATTDGSTSYLAPQWAPDGPQLVFLAQTFTDEFQDVMTSSRLATIDLLAVDAEPTMLTPIERSLGVRTGPRDRRSCTCSR